MSNKPEEAKSHFFEAVLPQLASSDTHLAAGKMNEWKLSKFSLRMLPALIYFNYRAETDKVRAAENLVSKMLEGSVSVDGWRARQIVDIAIGIGGAAGESRRVARRPSWVQKHVTNRGEAKSLEQQEERGEVQLV